MNQFKKSLFAVILLFVAFEADAENIAAFKTLAQISGTVQFTNNRADTIAGASYGASYQTAIAGEVDLGILATSHLYLGLAYDYWYAQREMSLNTEVTLDKLRYQSVGAEIGYYSVNPRVYYFVTATGFYPTTAQILSSTGTTYRRNGTLPSYRLKAGVGIRFNRVLSIFFAAGYRYASLGKISGGGAGYLPDGGTVDFSGPQFAAGFGIGF